MASTVKLLEVKYHDDTETGNHAIGEVDFGISGSLADYLKTYGNEGKTRIISALAYLMYEVERRFRYRPKNDALMSDNRTKSGSGFDGERDDSPDHTRREPVEGSTGT